MGYPAHLADGFAREDVMYSLIMLTIACAAAITGFCVMFALFAPEWNDS
jgi:hypothetical protein